MPGNFIVKILILALSASVVLATEPPPVAKVTTADSPENEIEALLVWLGTSGCVFIRNGKEHSAAEAEQHLRTKYQRARKHVKTPEIFIERLASHSSWSGESYRVQCAGENNVAIESRSADWLQNALREIRGGDS